MLGPGFRWPTLPLTSRQVLAIAPAARLSVQLVQGASGIQCSCLRCTLSVSFASGLLSPSSAERRGPPSGGRGPASGRCLTRRQIRRQVLVIAPAGARLSGLAGGRPSRARRASYVLTATWTLLAAGQLAGAWLQVAHAASDRQTSAPDRTSCTTISPTRARRASSVPAADCQLSKWALLFWIGQGALLRRLGDLARGSRLPAPGAPPGTRPDSPG